jgi:alpha-L-fucosidase
MALRRALFAAGTALLCRGACDVTLTRQISTADCIPGFSFGCADDSTMWASHGCNGLFDCNSVASIDCDSLDPTGAKRTACACGAPTPAPAPSPPAPPTPPPPPRTNVARAGSQQTAALGFELEMFVHFSIDTYTSDLDPTKFAPDPTTLNVSQWVATAVAMGARVAALTSKHEKGFCLWPSNYSNFTIAHSPTVGHRDLVREFTAACRAQGIQPGLYFTTTDTYNKDRPDKAAIQLAQMTELTTLYGDDIAYFWFDHHAGTDEWYAIDAIVRRHQPQCAMLGPDCWLTGQETGYAAYPMWHGVDTTDNTTHGRPVAADAPHGNPHGTWFKVWESDCSNYGGCHPWFFGGDDPQPLPLMLQHWEATYGLGHNYILNMPPSKDGIITPKMAASAAAFGAERLRRYGAGSSDPARPSACELARGSGRLAQWQGGEGGEGGGSPQTLVLALGNSSSTSSSSGSRGQPVFFDRIFLSEDVAGDGQLVGGYVVEACSAATLAACDAPSLPSPPSQQQQHSGTFSCQPGMGQSGDCCLVGHSADMSEAACGARCVATARCVAFDFCTHVPQGGDAQAACRMYEANTPRLGPGAGGVDGRQYCTLAPAPAPPVGAAWQPIVSAALSPKGGVTIGTHHIDVLGSGAIATFVRVRLLAVLDAPRPPLVSFRALDTRP